MIKVCISSKCCDERSKRMGASRGYYSKDYKEVKESEKNCPDCGGPLQSSKVKKVKKSRDVP